MQLLIPISNEAFKIFRSEVVAIVHTTGSTAINVAKLQEQLAKNMTIYTTGTSSSNGITNTGSNNENGQASDDSADSVRKKNTFYFFLALIGNNRVVVLRADPIVL